MTRRERLERKAERRREWAQKAAQRSAAAIGQADRISQRFEGGQPILVGHHSEGKARRDQERMHNALDRGVAEQQLASRHVAAAGGIEHALDRSIFSDDVDAVEALRARIAEREAEAERMKTVNRLFRKGDAAGLAALGLDLERLRADVARVGYSWVKVPFEPYQLSNLRGRITADRKRLEQIEAQTKRRDEAANMPNGVAVESCGDYLRITFAEKPSRDVLDALRGAGYSWGGGSWLGRREALPQVVLGLLASGEVL